MSMPKKYTIHASWDEPTKTWSTDGEDIPGLVCETDTFEELVKVILDLAPDLLHANVGLEPGERVEIKLIAERQVACIAA